MRPVLSREGSGARSGCSGFRLVGTGLPRLGCRGSGTIVRSLRRDSGAEDSEGRKEASSGPSHLPPLFLR